MKKALIELKGISKNFAGVKALQNVDLTIYEGETRCLAGENGCGKSTLIKIIAGVYVPNGGTIRIDGKEFSRLTPQQAIDAGIQIIYQDFAIFPNLTAVSYTHLDVYKRQVFVHFLISVLLMVNQNYIKNYIIILKICKYG